MPLELVERDDVRAGRGSGKKGKGEKYSKYVKAFGKIADWIKESISESNDGFVRLKSADLAENMGLKLRLNEKEEGLSSTALYWGTKYAAFHEGLVVTTGETKIKEPILIFRLKTDKDELPPSLSKGDREGEGENVENGEENGGDNGKEHGENESNKPFYIT